MSVLIKGMDELPEDGQMLVVKHVDGKAYIKRDDVMGFSMELVQLPDKHGRLVDADELEKAVAGMVPYAIDDASSSAYTDGIGAAYYLICDAPTIVETEGENG